MLIDETPFNFRAPARCVLDHDAHRARMWPHYWRFGFWGYSHRLRPRTVANAVQPLLAGPASAHHSVVRSIARRRGSNWIGRRFAPTLGLVYRRLLLARERGLPGHGMDIWRPLS